MAEELKIFIVEDEAPIAHFIKLELEHAGFATAIEENGIRAYERIMQEKFDLVLLDWMLPGMDGMEVCRKVRENSAVPVIMLTARSEVEDKVAGLNVGADDYLVKPFAMDELLARIQTILRRVKREKHQAEAQEEVIICGDMVVYPQQQEVRLHGTPVEMTNKEYQLLEFLLQHRQKIMSRDEIMQAIWGYEYTDNTNVVDVYVRHLRQKLEDANGGRKFIYTVRGMGYVVKD